ncbi:hypothetical protein MTO96_005202 [Rhipicephalus appendiculatus]
MAERQARHASNSIEVTELTEYLQKGNDLSATSVLHISEHCDGDGDGFCVDTTEIRIKSSAARASAGSGDSEDDLWFEESIRATALQGNVTELFILVPALLGLKGNLEMTMAARMSTQANLGNMDTLREQWKSASGNMALVQCQATVVSLLASLFAVMMGFITERRFDIAKRAHAHHINPDNVAIPVAASLGDLTTLALLAGAGSLLFGGTEDVRLYLCVVIFFLLFIPLWVLIARSNTYTSSVLWSGWIPIISAMAISSLGGSILDMTVPTFENLAVFQPVISGVAGNLVAIQTSRLSTYLHQRTKIGARPDRGRRRHLPRPVFLLLYLSRCMVYWMWARQIDPDNAAIPYLTALGDLLGIGLLALSFHLLRTLGDVNAMPQQLAADAEFSTEPTDPALAVDGG